MSGCIVVSLSIRRSHDIRKRSSFKRSPTGRIRINVREKHMCRRWFSQGTWCRGIKEKMRWRCMFAKSVLFQKQFHFSRNIQAKGPQKLGWDVTRLGKRLTQELSSLSKLIANSASMCNSRLTGIRIIIWIKRASAQTCASSKTTISFEEHSKTTDFSKALLGLYRPDLHGEK